MRDLQTCSRVVSSIQFCIRAFLDTRGVVSRNAQHKQNSKWPNLCFPWPACLQAGGQKTYWVGRLERAQAWRSFLTSRQIPWRSFFAEDSPLRQGEVLGSSAGSGPRQSPELPRRWRAQPPSSAKKRALKFAFVAEMSNLRFQACFLDLKHLAETVRPTDTFLAGRRAIRFVHEPFLPPLMNTIRPFAFWERADGKGIFLRLPRF